MIQVHIAPRLNICSVLLPMQQQVAAFVHMITLGSLPLHHLEFISSCKIHQVNVVGDAQNRMIYGHQICII